MKFIIILVGLLSLNLKASDFSFGVNKDLNISIPKAKIENSKHSKSKNDKALEGEVGEDEDFNPTLPKTEPPDEVKFAIKNNSIAKGFLEDIDDFDIKSVDEIKYLDLVIKDAKEQNFDVEFTLAIIKKESDFNPKLKSSAGAIGLMQVIPDTAKWLGLKNISKLSDPDTNIKYGIKYLRYLSSIFAGEINTLEKDDINKKEVIKVIAAYNAGPANVKKYDKEPYNGVPPFPETRNYVKKVPFYFIKFKELNIPK